MSRRRSGDPFPNLLPRSNHASKSKENNTTPFGTIFGHTNAVTDRNVLNTKLNNDTNTT